jgi:hypothetical protein
MLRADDGVYEGSPPEVLAALTATDYSAAGVCSALADYEETINEDGEDSWDMRPCFAVLMRSLPPKKVAEKLAEHGNVAMMLGLHMIDLPDNTNCSGGPHIADVIEHLAGAMAEDSEEAIKALMADNEGDWDLLAWLVIVEAWEVDVKAGRTGLRTMPLPSQHPDRFEVRVVAAVDRAGIRYQLFRRRDNGDRRLIVDMHQGTHPVFGVQGRIPDALAKLMDAVPAEI